MSTVATRLGPLHVEVDGDGPPAVLWPSLFVDSTTWTRLRPALAAVRRLILVDGPGHGRSGRPPESFTMDDCQAAAGDVLDRLGITGPVDWLGNAWGGHTGLAFAAAQPDRVRTVLTIGTPVSALPEGERRSIRLGYAVHRLLGPRPVATVVADALLGGGYRKSDPEAARIVVAGFVRSDRPGMRAAIRSISLDRTDATGLLPQVKAPTLMVTGADDASCSPADTAAWAALIPNGQHRVVPGAGHVAPLFDPATADVIAQFWADGTS
ncbi:alpha/beta fold hydrolase [Dactylosporangium sp. CS-033363]|uniref:alpha/beta fold hydrolase n=1 Tax=Dactylosporangium sp. CS-033363 TaxID=3239935 RepID=UPI003D90DDF7